MKTEAAITTSSDSGKSELSPAADDSSMHSGSVVLIPKPSDDPRDPLVRQLAHLKRNRVHPNCVCNPTFTNWAIAFQNWPFRKKCATVAVLSLALFAGYAAPFCGQLNLVQQAALYHKTTVQITYFVSFMCDR